MHWISLFSAKMGVNWYVARNDASSRVVQFVQAWKILTAHGITISLNFLRAKTKLLYKYQVNGCVIDTLKFYEISVFKNLNAEPTIQLHCSILNNITVCMTITWYVMWYTDDYHMTMYCLSPIYLIMHLEASYSKIISNVNLV